METFQQCQLSLSSFGDVDSARIIANALAPVLILNRGIDALSGSLGKEKNEPSYENV